MDKNHFKLAKDVTLKIIDNAILIQKGIFNFVNIEIISGQDISKEDFSLVRALIKNLQNDQVIQIGKQYNSTIQTIFADLQKYAILTKMSNLFIPHYLITDFEKIENIISIFPMFNHCEIIDLADKNKIVSLKEGNLIILINKFHLSELKKLNKILFDHKMKAIYLINDGEYVHALYTDNQYSGCFECFVLRSMSRINKTIDFEDSFSYGMWTNFENNQTNLLLLLGIINAIIEKSNAFNSMLLTSKIFSIYLPTFEVQFDQLLKIALCTTCGYTSQMQSQELNINLVTTIQDLSHND